MKAVTLISAVVLIGFTISVVALVYRTGMPIVERMQDSAEVERIKSAFVDLDDRIQRVASEANGSRRTLSFKIEPGDFVVDGQNDVVYWALDTEAQIFSPRTASYYGSLAFGSNLETKAYEDVYSGIPSYVLENEHLKVYVRRIGSTSSPQNYTTSDLLVALYQKDLGQWTDADLEISINNDPLTETGNGYTVVEKHGKALTYGRVSAYMDSSFDYYVNITLESGADFLEIEGGAI